MATIFDRLVSVKGGKGEAAEAPHGTRHTAHRTSHPLLEKPAQRFTY